ncbi:hypothetical protein MMC18_007357 [Xylographa bjoerkii]|nr:hypothetical protein [Xylographa bjoerkii]
MYAVSTLASVLAVVATATAQTPPGFSPSATAKLGLSFGNITISPGEQIGINGQYQSFFRYPFNRRRRTTIPASAPIISTSSPMNEYYLFALVDPDAESPQNPNISQYLHFLQPGLTFPSSSAAPAASYPAVLNSAPIVPYTQPAPPNFSTAHRYIGLLFSQPSNFSVPVNFQQYNASYRMFFNITTFAAEAGLGAPVLANYFLVSNQTMTANGTTNATTTGTGIPIATFTGEAAMIRVAGLWIMAGVVGAYAVLVL